MSLGLSLKVSLTFISFSITSHQDFEDSERVPHVLLADVFVPASEKTGDDSSKDWKMAVECKEDSRQDLPYEELTKVHFEVIC